MTITQRLGRLITAAFVAFVLGGLILIAGAPHANAEEPPPTVWQTWIMPNDGTDWPQLVASEANLAALPCGTTWRIQNDEYLPHERDQFVADGILHYGEDFGNEYQRGAISWFFSEHVTPACEPEPEPTVTPIPEPEPTVVEPAPCEADNSCYTADTPTGPVVIASDSSQPILAETGPDDQRNERLRVIGGVALGLMVAGLVCWGVAILRRERIEGERTEDQ